MRIASFDLTTNYKSSIDEAAFLYTLGDIDYLTLWGADETSESLLDRSGWNAETFRNEVVATSREDSKIRKPSYWFGKNRLVVIENDDFAYVHVHTTGLTVSDVGKLVSRYYRNRDDKRFVVSGNWKNALEIKGGLDQLESELEMRYYGIYGQGFFVSSELTVVEVSPAAILQNGKVPVVIDINTN